MARAIAPTETPKLPEDAIGWRRSTKRPGGMFHAHALGFPSCGARMVLDRHKSVGPEGVHDFQYWGVCPKCFKLGGN